MDSTQPGKATSHPAPKQLKTDRKYCGQTIIRGQVNQKITQAATAATLGVRPEDVKVNIFDDRGKIGFDITTLVRHDDVMRCALRADQSIYTMIQQARQNIVQQVTKVAGLQIGTVNIRLSGTKKTKTERGLK